MGHGSSHKVQCLEMTPNTDCVGEWSTCAADCSDATYTVSVPSSGTGAACEAEDGATQTCSPGQGNCPLNTDCAGEWSACTDACETASQRTWTETAAQSGGGAACPAATDCSPGDGDCPSLE